MYYAVYEGKSKGIYYNWNDCKSQVSGYKNAKYKKFNNFEAAQYFLENGSVQEDKNSIQNDKTDINTNTLSNYIDIYTDGSLIRKNSYIGCGYGIYIPELNIKTSCILYENKTNNRAELKAIIDAINIMKSKGKTNLHIHTDSQYSIYIYGDTGIRYQKKDFKNVINKDLVIEALKSKENMKLYFSHIKAHTGIIDDHYKGNDLADDLANKSAVKDYINQDKKWLNYSYKFGKYDCILKNIPIEYIKDTINSDGYINLCRKNESHRTLKNILLHYIELVS